MALDRSSGREADLLSCIGRELALAGIALDASARNLTAARMLARGERQFEDLRAEIGNCLDAHRRPCIRSLGTGAAFTEFAVAGVPVPPSDAGAVISLGGLFLLIVSAFDMLIDSGCCVPELFSFQTSSDRQTLIERLLDLYFRRLREIPRRHPEVEILIQKAIRRMYTAERASTGQGEVTRSIWWRKNALPLLAMGAPAWLASFSFSPTAFRRHMAWLGRVGECFGWLDDCVDRAEDIALGHANRVEIRLRDTSELCIARKIAAQAKRVLLEWEASNGASPERNVFTLIVWSWIENRRAQLISEPLSPGFTRAAASKRQSLPRPLA